ncbi:transcriptional regulator [Glaciecola siphonariae]|uniref:Transcriptional regulator n=1 Tax=Glaciecola siphonariae TaxID=521012 RepID=A0ABV9LSV4_9ALTE
MSVSAFERAIIQAGGQTSLGRKIGKSQGQISIWLNRDKKLPAEFVIAVEKVSGVPRHELRPDIYPPDEYKKAG